MKRTILLILITMILFQLPGYARPKNYVFTDLYFYDNHNFLLVMGPGIYLHSTPGRPTNYLAKIVDTGIGLNSAESGNEGDNGGLRFDGMLINLNIFNIKYMNMLNSDSLSGRMDKWDSFNHSGLYEIYGFNILDLNYASVFRYHNIYLSACYGLGKSFVSDDYSLMFDIVPSIGFGQAMPSVDFMDMDYDEPEDNLGAIIILEPTVKFKYKKLYASLESHAELISGTGRPIYYVSASAKLEYDFSRSWSRDFMPGFVLYIKYSQSAIKASGQSIYYGGFSLGFEYYFDPVDMMRQTE